MAVKLFQMRQQPGFFRPLAAQVRDTKAMHFGGRVSPNRPDPMEELGQRARALRIAVAGLVAQPHLEDWGVSGWMSAERTIGDASVTVSATLSRMYTVWRNPVDRNDPINLADLTDEVRRGLDQLVPDDLPVWIVRQRDRMRFPTIWEAVYTHWFVPGEMDSIERTDLGDLLVSHVDHVLQNLYRAEYGLGDPTAEHGQHLVQRDAVTKFDVVVDGQALDGVTIDTNPFVLGLAARLADGRVLTAVLPRALLDLIVLEFTDNTQ